MGISLAGAVNLVDRFRGTRMRRTRARQQSRIERRGQTRGAAVSILQNCVPAKIASPVDGRHLYYKQATLTGDVWRGGRVAQGKQATR